MVIRKAHGQHSPKPYCWHMNRHAKSPHGANMKLAPHEVAPGKPRSLPNTTHQAEDGNPCPTHSVRAKGRAPLQCAFQKKRAENPLKDTGFLSVQFSIAPALEVAPEVALANKAQKKASHNRLTYCFYWSGKRDSKASKPKAIALKYYQMSIHYRYLPES